MKKFLFFLLAIVFSGCTMLQPPSARMHASLKGWNYQYIYITPTIDITSITSTTDTVSVASTTDSTSTYKRMLDGFYRIFRSKSKPTVNPADIITGHFVKKGYIRVAEIKPDIADKTLVINYGETNSGYIGVFRKVGVVIQMVSAETNELVCVCSGEGKGRTEDRAKKNAIDGCMDTFFRF